MKIEIGFSNGKIMQTINDKYKIIKKIGQGSMSEVYLAHDLQSNGKLAIKKISKNTTNSKEEAFLRFLRETNILKTVEHKHIVKIYTNFEQDNFYYIVMEYFDGYKLNDISKNLSILNKVKIIKDISSALEYIHSKDVIHRDIKPSNILVKNNGKIDVRIIDFGLSHLMHLEDIFKKGSIVGSLAYISPEQTGILKRNIDNRTDLYSLGAAFYELLTGRPPFIEKDFSKLIYDHLAEIPKIPSNINKEIHPMLDKIILKLLNKEPSERYQSAHGLKEDLEYFINNPEKKVFAIAAKDIKSKLNLKIKTIGREKELSLLTKLFEKSKTGESQFCFIIGKSGTGKSKLFEEFKTNNISTKTTIVTYKCSNASKNIPYSPFYNLFKSYFDNYLEKESKTVLKEKINKYKSILLNIFPFLTEYFDILETNQKYEVNNNQELNNAVIELINTLGSLNKNTVFNIDDLQWADKDSIILLNEIAEKIKGKIFFLATIREEEFKEDLIINFTKKSFTTKMFIEGIKKDDMNNFISNVISSNNTFTKEFYDTIYNETKGIPFYILELLKKLFDAKIIYNEENLWYLDKKGLEHYEFNNDLAKILKDRISNLPKEYKEILTLASVIGKDFYLNHLYELVKTKGINCSFSKLVSIIDKCINDNIIETYKGHSSTKYSFSHDKLIESLYDNLSKKEKINLNSICAKTLEEKFPLNDEILYRIAFHYNRTNNNEKMLFYNEKAYELSKKKNSINQTIYYLRKIVDYKLKENNIDEKLIELILDLSTNMQNAGEINESIEYIEIAEKKAINENWQNYLKDIHLSKGTAYYFLNNQAEAIKYFASSIKIAKELGTEIKVGYPYRFLGSGYWFNSEFKKGIEYLTKAIEYTDESDTANLIAAYGIRSWTYSFMGKMQKAMDDVKAVEKLIHKVDNPLVLSQAYHMIGNTYSLTGYDFDKGLEYSFNSTKLAEKINYTTFEYSSRLSRSYGYLYKNEYDKSIKACKEAILISKEHEILIGIHFFHACLAEAYFCKKEYSKAAKYADKFLNDRDNIPAKDAVIQLITAKAGFLFYENKIDECIKILEIAYELFKTKDLVQHNFFNIMLLAMLYRQNGDLKKSLILKKELINTTIEDNLNDFFYLRAEQMLTDLISNKNVSSNRKTIKDSFQLQNIINMSQAVSSILNTDELLKNVMEKLLQITGATRGAILLYNKNTGELENKVIRKTDKESDEFKISQKVVKKVETTKKGIVVSNIDNKSSIDSSQSIIAENIRSIICTPLMYQSKLLGLIYLDSKLIDNLFNEEDLELLNVFATQTAIAIDNSYAYEEVEKEKNTLEIRVKERTKELSTSKNFIESVIENAPLAIIVTDVEGNIRIINKKCEEILEYDRNNLLDTNIRKYNSITETKIISHFKSATQGKSSRIENLNFKSSVSKKELIISYFIMPIVDATDTIDSIIMMFFDNTQKAIAERTLNMDLKLAKKIQSSLVSTENFENNQINFCIKYIPMMEVGGDIYDIYQLKKDLFRIFIADATGHGVQAALLTMLIKSEYEKIKMFEMTPKKLMEILNSSFYRRYGNLVLFFTSIIIDIDLKRKEITLSSAGHPNAIFIKNNEIMSIKSKGKMVGLIENVEYENKVLNFEKNDKLFCFTDGIFEEFDTNNEEFGEERLKNFIDRNKEKKINEICSLLISSVKQFSKNNKFEDDITLIGIQFN